MSRSQYQDGDKISYYEKKALKQLPETSGWPQFSDAGEYDHMELIDYIEGLFKEYLTTRLLPELIQHSKDMLVFGTQKSKKSMAAENGHDGIFKLSEITAIVL
ncbi:hypothetical protein O181_038772 [Austropuccinia psidii MF-1]|uniref:Uncharacterized protein n=1 Tax=Austropuccinia psidii MF-1 TaxID=1389203 RepID=A0A9Q3DBK4_9BASI|nr:hypothetical protein [Austropuccinia psidii MF-1]